MKKKNVIFAACVLLLTLCACQENPTVSVDTTPSASAEDNSSVTTTMPEPTPAATEALTPEPSLTDVPDPEPTSTPIPSTTPETTTSPSPTPSNSPASTSPVVSSEQLEAYFNGSVFIGDSIMEGIRRYVSYSRTQEPTLGNAQFLTSSIGVSVDELLDNERGGPYFRYNGKNQYLLQILPQMDCKRIFILMGLNDMAAVNPVVETSIEKYSKLIDLLQRTVPDAEIVIITNPPKVASTWLPDYTPNRNFGNKLITEFVDALIKMCEAKGIPYVDAHTALEDANGVLPDDCCNDGFVHLSNKGAAVVVEELYRFAAERIG